MGTLLQALNLVVSCMVILLLWRMSDRLDPIRTRLPGQGIGVIERFRKRLRFRPIKHTKVVGPEQPIFRNEKHAINYYVPKDNLDAEPFLALFYPEAVDPIPSDSYVVDGHVIPGETFREQFVVANVAVALQRPDSNEPSSRTFSPDMLRIHPRSGTPRITAPARQRVTFENYPKVEMTEEEQQKLAEEYELFDEPRNPAA